MTTPAAPPTDLKNALEELRASVAARATGKGLKGTIEDAILLFLGLLLKMVEDFRAGKLAPIAPPAKAAEPEDASPRLVRPAAQAAQGGDLSRGSGAGHSDAGRRRIPRADCGREDDSAAPTPRAIANERASCAERGDGAPVSARDRDTRARHCSAPFAPADDIRSRYLLAEMAEYARRSPGFSALQGRFFKNADSSGGIDAALLFQDENDMITARG